ncbi:pilus assembly PilX N-terminal domain-containing protein [Shewanella gelidimarina]|uniref:pilus assembly PilX family protein n=1 Tax=Shewanella gelidimarina TaxID=56813 RepID=UPI00200BA6DF|nr:pilus assembly PilX N-terminal domain-containing protein [Shewanella gelidimarina]MCL1056981.1 pilus assembly PilX N-terminal domain-containing protein [Shewanella gelidimarina]
MKKQQGIVLFFSLIVLIIMTVIGVALAVNSSQSMRMAGAGSERIAAMAAAHGAQAQVLENNKGSVLANSIIEIKTIDNTMGVSVENKITPLQLQDVSCQRSTKASSSNLISCRRFEASSKATFGRSDMGGLSVVAGIEQEVLTGS